MDWGRHGDRAIAKVEMPCSHSRPHSGLVAFGWDITRVSRPSLSSASFFFIVSDNPLSRACYTPLVVARTMGVCWRFRGGLPGPLGTPGRRLHPNNEDSLHLYEPHKHSLP